MHIDCLATLLFELVSTDCLPHPTTYLPGSWFLGDVQRRPPQLWHTRRPWRYAPESHCDGDLGGAAVGIDPVHLIAQRRSRKLTVPSTVFVNEDRDKNVTAATNPLRLPVTLSRPLCRRLVGRSSGCGELRARWRVEQKQQKQQQNQTCEVSGNRTRTGASCYHRPC